MDNENVISVENNEDINIEKNETTKAKKLMKLLPLLLVLIGLVALFVFVDISSDMSHAKDYAQDIVTNKIENGSGGKVIDIDITSVETNRFKGEAEDEYGLFEYLSSNPITSVDGTQYKSHVEEIQKEDGLNVYKLSITAYEIKGECTFENRDGKKMTEEFSLTVFHISMANHWTFISDDSIFEDGRNLKSICEGDVRTYITLTYDVKNCQINITDTVKENSETILYGKVYITDHYGDEYGARFKATYKYNGSDFEYEQTDFEMEEPVKNKK